MLPGRPCGAHSEETIRVVSRKVSASDGLADGEELLVGSTKNVPVSSGHHGVS